VDKDAANEGVISAASRVTVCVIGMDEARMIPRSVRRVLGLGMGCQERKSDHATEYISGLDPFSAGVPP
jgi:hypothetical protein